MYLTEGQLRTNLKIGKSIEQWIGFSKETNYTILKWIRIDKETDNSFSITFFEVFDEGSLDFLDVYEFGTVDPDEPYGIIQTFENIESVLKYASNHYNADNHKYVNSGLVQEEYKKYLEER